ncbi:MAG: cadmium-translocating P-type ATPase [Clostridiales bacterium]|nr:cadmium-translocating P-type ATPase [Clostridiales bacterium]
MNKVHKKDLYRIFIGSALFAAALLIPAKGAWKAALFLLPYAVTGADVLLLAARNIKKGRIFDENLLMSLASIGAFCIREYPEAVAVMLFYRVGELAESYAVGKARRSISALMDIRPDYAVKETGEGLIRVDPEDIAVGDVIVVKTGERVPLDGIVIEGRAFVDTAALTGESVPRQVQAGDEVISGFINSGGLLKIKVEKTFGESTVVRILELVEDSAARKAKTESFISRFARYYTPIVVIGAVFLAVLPPLFFSGIWSDWLMRALIFLVISCPCALVISVPLSFFGGIGGASKSGILIKGGNYLEALAKAEIIAFDKTGTLTKGTFRVTQINPENGSSRYLLRLAAYAESYSDHPVSRSIKEAFGEEIDPLRVTEAEEISGLGVRVRMDGQVILAGNGKLMDANGVRWKVSEGSDTVVHVAVDGEYKGNIVISDEIKEDSAAAIAELKRQGIEKTVMLTGDLRHVGEKTASELGIDAVYAELLPEGKVIAVEALLNETTAKGKLVYVGDGINDAPALSRADIGIAMGALGSDAALEAADIVLMDDSLSKISTALTISRKTHGIVIQNIAMALGFKALVMVLGVLGYATMWAAVFADVGVSVLAIANAARALNAGGVKHGRSMRQTREKAGFKI